MELAVSCTVRVTAKDCSVNSLEAAALEGAREAGRQLFVALLGLIEQQRTATEQRCPCGSRLKSRGLVARVLTTLVGTVRFRRRRLRCPACGAERYPLDEAVGLSPHHGVTTGLAERALWLATEMAYDRAVAGLQHLCGVQVSDGTIKSLMHDEGTRLLAEQAQGRQQVFGQGATVPEGPPKPLVFVQVDGTGINDRATKGWFEAKVGVIYSERKEVAKDRIEIVDKRTYATVEDIATFREAFVLEATRFGVFQASEVLFVSDGAHWCQQLQQDSFPEATAVLDFWHLARNLRVTFGAERRRIAEGLLAFAGRGDVEAMLRWTRSLRARSRDPTDQGRLGELITYLEHNAEGIRNAVKLDFYGSGPVEKAVDVTICRRFKKRGTSWYVHGAGPLLALRLLKLNGEWEAYWRHRGLVTV